jgi:hypothetical protein
VLLVIVAARPGGYLPAMYVIQVLPFFAIVTVGMLAGLAARLRTWAGRLAPRGQLIVVIASTAALVGALGYVVPRWYDGDRRAVDTNANAAYASAAAYLGTRLPHRQNLTVVVDDVLWLDLVRDGYPMDHVMWFYKVDLDPAVAARLPNGWSDVDYVVSTPAIRQVPDFLPTVRSLLSHSTVVAGFGDGDGRVEIRRINKEES